jgi:hypothetical protein
MTRPMPVIMPAHGTSSSYMPCAASWDSSKNGEPGSSSRRTRSRGSSLPRARWRSRARSSPPCLIRCTTACRSSISARIAAALAWNAGERVSIALPMTLIG